MTFKEIMTLLRAYDCGFIAITKEQQTKLVDACRKLGIDEFYQVMDEVLLVLPNIYTDLSMIAREKGWA